MKVLMNGKIEVRFCVDALYIFCHYEIDRLVCRKCNFSFLRINILIVFAWQAFFSNCLLIFIKYRSMLAIPGIG